MVIKMLLINDIPKKIVQMILHFQKEINVMTYNIEKKINQILTISFGQIFNKIRISKFYVFIMLKMKYLINKMQCNTLSKQV